MPTEAGERLFDTLAPMFDEIENELTSLGELREQPVGMVRIMADEHAAAAILWPARRRILPDYVADALRNRPKLPDDPAVSKPRRSSA